MTTPACRTLRRLLVRLARLAVTLVAAAAGVCVLAAVAGATGIGALGARHAVASYPATAVAAVHRLAPAAAPTPSPAASPSPSPSLSASPQPSGGISPRPSPKPSRAKPKECGALDLGCRVGQSLNGWFTDLARSAVTPVFTALGSTLLSTPQVEQIPRVAQIWSGTVAVANSVFVLLVIAGGVIVMGYETLHTSYTVKDIAPRLVVGFVAANFSSLLAGKAIEFANALAGALLGPGIDPKLAAQMLTDRIEQSLAAGGVFLVLLVLVAIGFAVVLSLVYVIRLTVTIVLVAAAPLALACHALPHTESFAHLWWRALSGVLAIQVAQALVFIVALRVLLTPDGALPISQSSQFFDLLIIICLLYILIRIPSWISHQVLQGGLGRSPIIHLTRYVVLRTTIHRALNPRNRTGGGGGRGRRRP
jgi:hypothetical protein